MDDDERYKACDELPVACPECKHQGHYKGVSVASDTTSGELRTRSMQLTACSLCDLQLVCNTEGTMLTAGLKCFDIGGKEGCAGMLAGTAGNGHNRYLCNHTTLAVRHYLAKYYNSPYLCEECNATTKDIPGGSMHTSAGSEALPCPLAGCQGSMARQFSSHDLYTQLSYLRYLFDHERQRDNLQRKRTCPC